VLGEARVAVRRGERRAGRVEQDRGAHVGRHLGKPGGDLLGCEPLGSVGRRHLGQNIHVPLSRIAWLVTVAICLIAALLLVLNEYYGYSGVLLAVGAAAAVNLTG
jgi:hypothetical protein